MCLRFNRFSRVHNLLDRFVLIFFMKAFPFVLIKLLLISDIFSSEVDFLLNTFVLLTPVAKRSDGTKQRSV